MQGLTMTDITAAEKSIFMQIVHDGRMDANLNCCYKQV